MSLTWLSSGEKSVMMSNKAHGASGPDEEADVTYRRHKLNGTWEAQFSHVDFMRISGSIYEL